MKPLLDIIERQSARLLLVTLLIVTGLLLYTIHLDRRLTVITADQTSRAKLLVAHPPSLLMSLTELSNDDVVIAKASETIGGALSKLRDAGYVILDKEAVLMTPDHVVLTSEDIKAYAEALDKE